MGAISTRRRRRNARLFEPYTFIEGGAGFNSRLCALRAHAGARRRRARRSRTPSACANTPTRALPRIEQQLGAAVPIYPELEELRLVFSLERMREWLGPDHPIVRQLLVEGIAGRARQARWSTARSSPIPAVRMRAVERRRGRHRRVQRSDDRARARASIREARTRAQVVRRRGRSAVASAHGEHRARALRGARHERLSGRDVHAAAELRHGAGLERERHAGRAVHAAVARCSSARRARSRSASRRAGCRRRTSST